MSKNPGHFTESGTRKFQSNGPIAWSPVFKDAAGSNGREGEGIRAALAFAVANRKEFVAWAGANPGQWAPAMRASEYRAPKAPKAPKAARSTKATTRSTKATTRSTKATKAAKVLRALEVAAANEEAARKVSKVSKAAKADRPAQPNARLADRPKVDEQAHIPGV